VLLLAHIFPHDSYRTTAAVTCVMPLHVSCCYMCHAVTGGMLLHLSCCYMCHVASCVTLLHVTRYYSRHAVTGVRGLHASVNSQTKVKNYHGPHGIWRIHAHHPPPSLVCYAHNDSYI